MISNGRTNRKTALPVLVVLIAVTLGVSRATAQTPSASGPLYEVRSYHFEPSRIDDYRSWVTNHAIQYLRRELDVVGFWVGGDIPAEVRGAPLDSLGSANVTWIIRWHSKAERDAKIGEVFSTPQWSEIFSRLPGGRSGYLRIESRFLEEI